LPGYHLESNIQYNQHTLIDKKFIPALSFDFLTDYYDRIIKIIMPFGFREILMHQAQPFPNEYILDFGTGTAELAILIKKKRQTSNVIAIDIDPKVLKIAKRKIIRESLDIQIIEYDGKTFPLSSDSFDKVVSCLVFHHLSPDQKNYALSEIYRVLKTGGKIYIADWGLERNAFKATFMNLFKYFDSLKYIVEHATGLFPEYISKAGFKYTVETGFLKTRTGTLCYYEAQK